MKLKQYYDYYCFTIVGFIVSVINITITTFIIINIIINNKNNMISFF